jgi:hypothetical protein
VVGRNHHDAAADAREPGGALDRLGMAAGLDHHVRAAIGQVADTLVRLVVAVEGAETELVRALDARRAYVHAEDQSAAGARDHTGEEPERPEPDDAGARIGRVVIMLAEVRFQVLL